MDTPAPYEYGTVATYVCDTSYGVSGGEGVLFCGGDGSDTAGSWGTSMPTCERELYSSSSCTVWVNLHTRLVIDFYSIIYLLFNEYLIYALCELQ